MKNPYIEDCIKSIGYNKTQELLLVSYEELLELLNCKEVLYEYEEELIRKAIQGK
jgi:hypothetical protein